MPPKPWVCYLIASLDSNDTYVGSTNDQPKRLGTHNVGKGAKRTKGQTWIPILVISGFHDKRACLSFEAGWKRLSKSRSNKKLADINQLCDTNLSYGRDTRWNRLMDLLYFLHNTTLLDSKFVMNHDMKLPLNSPEELVMNVFMEDFIADLPWPYFIEIQIASCE